VAGAICPPSRLAQQCLPLRPRQATMVEIGPRPLPPVIKEADVIVLLLKGLDLFLDEAIERCQILAERIRNFEVHRIFPVCRPKVAILTARAPLLLCLYL